MKESINIIDEMTKGNYENSIILSYNCSLIFYEGLILRKIWNNGCYNNSIIMDHNQYTNLINEEKDKAQFCGSNYYMCDSIAVSGVFHPKVILLTGKKSGLLFIGTGNSTFSGYGKNYELFYKFKYSNDNPEHLLIFQQIVDYINRLQEMFNLNPVINKRIEMLRRETPWLKNKSMTTEEIILHNLDKPILNQLSEKLPKNIKKIVLIAPYFDKRLYSILNLQKRYPQADIEIITQSGNTNFPIEFFLSKKDTFPRVSLYRFRALEEGRVLHAKLLYFQGGDREFLFLGSANISRPALELDISKGNAEIGVLISEKTGSRISSLWKKYAEKQRIKSAADLKVNITVQAQGKALSRFPIIRIDNPYIENNVLYLNYESKKRGRAEVFINYQKICEKEIQAKGQIRAPLDINTIEVIGEGYKLVQLKIGNEHSNLLWAGDMRIRRSGRAKSLTKHLNALTKYMNVDNISRMRAIIDLTTNLDLQEITGNELLKGQKLVDQEEGGDEQEEELQLPRERFFIEEKPEFYDIANKLHILSQNWHGNALNILAVLLSSIKGIESIRQKPGGKRVDIEAKVFDNSEPSMFDIQETQKRMTNRARRIVLRFRQGIGQDNCFLVAHSVAGVNQFLSFLIWLWSGIQMGIGEDRFTVSFLTVDYMNESVGILRRLWQKTKEQDYLEQPLNKSDYLLLSMINTYILSLCLISFNLWLLKKDESFLENLEEYQSRLLDIYFSILEKARKIPDDLFEKILSDQNTEDVIRRLICVPDFVLDISLRDLIKTNITKDPILRGLKISNALWRKKIISNKKIELAELEREMEAVNEDLFTKTEQLKKKEIGVLDYILTEQKARGLSGKIERVEKIVNLPIDEVMPIMKKIKLPDVVVKYFHIK